MLECFNCFEGAPSETNFVISDRVSTKISKNVSFGLRKLWLKYLPKFLRNERVTVNLLVKSTFYARKVFTMRLLANHIGVVLNF